mmetsp:Transcript_85235/g.138193  ORF Transcript_85235/g.138193 Transcript_85235/m.138193 type:complete len:83 (+) Transcript_85235:197-445(+)
MYSTIFYFIFCIPVLCFQEFFQCHVLKNFGSSLGSFVSVFYISFVAIGCLEHMENIQSKLQLTNVAVSAKELCVFVFYGDVE